MAERCSENIIKAVVFDVGGVLQLGGNPKIKQGMIHTSGVHERVAKKLKITIDQYFDSIDTIYAKSIEGHVSKEVLMGVLACNLNCPKDKLKKIFMDAYRAVYKRNNWLFSVAKQLKERGYKIAVLSDQWHISKDALMPEKDFKIFDEVVVSCDVRIRKPNKEIYEVLLNKLKLKPGEVLFVDNQIWNLVPANKFGMKTILFTDNKKAKEQFSDFGIYVK